jgi:hypothetical protein
MRRLLIAHVIEFVILCGGSEIDPGRLREATATLDRLVRNLRHSQKISMRRRQLGPV